MKMRAAPAARWIPWALFGVFALAGISAEAQPRRPTAEVDPLLEVPGAHAGTTVRAALQVRLPAGFHVQSNKPRDPSLIPTVLTVDPPAGVSVTEIVYPAPTELKQAGVDQPLAVFEQDFAIGIQLAIAPAVPPGDVLVPMRLHYQACDATMCYIPTTAVVSLKVPVVPTSVSVERVRPSDVFGRIPFGHGESPRTGGASQLAASAGVVGDDAIAQLADFAVLGTTGGYLPTSEFLTFIHDAETGVRPRNIFEGRGPLAILLIVFLGGLALNLTPCVLPMIPINLAIIGAGAQAGSRRRGFLLGAAYGGAMALVYGVLGLVVILTAGTFGTINSSPWFNLAIAALFVVLGLAMFDVIVIDFSRYTTRLSPEGSRGSFAVAFGMGAVAALLAGACVAPVVIQVVLFASNLYGTGTTIALVLPFCLGVGMAIPWPVAGAGIAALPRPGAWMVRVKQVFGVLILATAAYYGFVAYGIFANRWVDASAVTASVQEKVKEGWYSSLGDGLAAAKREQKPVLIDLWASWCKNCLTMDKTTMQDPRVVSALNEYVKIKVQAEQPDEPPAKTIMRRFDAVGLPTYVILKPKTLELSSSR